MQRKDYNEVTNKIVNIEEVVSRGQREPVFELTFKTSGYNRTGGHRVYIDYQCGKELLKKLSTHIDNVQSKYFVDEYYQRIQRPQEKMFL